MKRRAASKISLAAAAGTSSTNMSHPSRRKARREGLHSLPVSTVMASACRWLRPPRARRSFPPPLPGVFPSHWACLRAACGAWPPLPLHHRGSRGAPPAA
eukprot:10891112-Lingulodinium_polyedra.AAC.1